MVVQRHATGRPVLGICGGYQMLGRTIVDAVEGEGAHEEELARVDGLGLLPVTIEFQHEKVLARPTGSWDGHTTTGYEIHHGVPTPLAAPDEDFLDGMRVGTTWGTHWHGALEHDDFRRGWLQRVAEQAGHPWRPHPAAPGYGERREQMIDTLADAIEHQLDVDAILELATKEN